MPAGKSRRKAKDDRGLRDRIIDAALAAIAENGWQGTGCGDVIDRAGVGAAEFYREFDDLVSVVIAAMRRANAEMHAASVEIEPEDTVRERLFTLLMARFDTASPHRATISAVLRAIPFDPQLAMRLLHALAAMAEQALTLAGAGGPGGRAGHFLRARLLLVSVILPTARVWLRDDSPDLAKTMVALDAALARAERAARLFARSEESEARKEPL